MSITAFKTNRQQVHRQALRTSAHIITDEPLPGYDATRRLSRRPPATSRHHSPAHVIPGLTGNPEGNG
ncbi:MAG: hypothetical protein ACI39U_03710, partial [Candidatus Cryptobacteroides sp.]